MNIRSPTRALKTGLGLATALLFVSLTSLTPLWAEEPQALSPLRTAVVFSLDGTLVRRIPAAKADRYRAGRTIQVDRNFYRITDGAEKVLAQLQSSENLDVYFASANPASIKPILDAIAAKTGVSVYKGPEPQRLLSSDLRNLNPDLSRVAVFTNPGSPDEVKVDGPQSANVLGLGPDLFAFDTWQQSREMLATMPSNARSFADTELQWNEHQGRVIGLLPALTAAQDAFSTTRVPFLESLRKRIAEEPAAARISSGLSLLQNGWHPAEYLYSTKEQAQILALRAKNEATCSPEVDSELTRLSRLAQQLHSIAKAKAGKPGKAARPAEAAESAVPADSNEAKVAIAVTQFTDSLLKEASVRRRYKDDLQEATKTIKRFLTADYLKCVQKGINRIPAKPDLNRCHAPIRLALRTHLYSDLAFRGLRDIPNFTDPRLRRALETVYQPCILKTLETGADLSETEERACFTAAARIPRGVPRQPGLGLLKSIDSAQGGCDRYALERSSFGLSKLSAPPREIAGEAFPRSSHLQYRGLSTAQYTEEDAIAAMLGESDRFVGTWAFTRLMNALKSGRSTPAAEPYLDRFRIRAEFTQLLNCRPAGYGEHQARLYAADLLDKGFKKLSPGDIERTYLNYDSGTYVNFPDDLIFSTVHSSIASNNHGGRVLVYDNSAERGIDLNYWNFNHHGKWTEADGYVSTDYGEFVTPGYIAPEAIQGFQFHTDKAMDYSFYKYEQDDERYVLIFDGQGKAGITKRGDQFFFTRPSNLTHPNAPAGPLEGTDFHNRPALIGVIALDSPDASPPGPEIFERFPKSRKTLPSSLLNRIRSLKVLGHPVKLYFPETRSPGAAR